MIGLFWLDVTKAQSLSKNVLVHAIAQDPSWQAKAWLLEKLHPEDFGQNRFHTIKGDKDAPPIKSESTGILRVVIEESETPTEENPELTEIIDETGETQ